MCKFKDLEEDLVKDLFISNMNNTSIQMDLLSDVRRTPQQVLNFAINKERGQAKQQEILLIQIIPIGLTYHTSEATHLSNHNKDNPNNQYYEHQQRGKQNHVSSAVSHSSEFTSTCVKHKILHAKYA